MASFTSSFTIGTFGPLGNPGGVGTSGGGSTPAAQQSFPTSAYGQVVPVIWGKARVPGGYIWAPDIVTRTTTLSPLETATTTRTVLSARIRFARPLVSESTWRVRKIWADGVLLYDASRGYKKSGFNFREYDGQSTQGRDPTMVDKEGTANVSAHRGYLDIVVRNYTLATDNPEPPAFEAEWVQDATSSTDTDSFTGFVADAVNSQPAAAWDAGILYGYSSSSNYIRVFSIGSLQEVFAVPVAGASGIHEESFRYIREIDRCLALEGTSPYDGVLIDPTTGSITARTSIPSAPTGLPNTTCHLRIGSVSLLLVAAFLTSRLTISRFPDANTAEVVGDTGSGWGGYSAIECIAPGEIRADTADVWVCADDKLVKLVVNSFGGILSTAEFATLTDNPIYAVYHEGDVIVWTDNAEVIRINGTTGATVWTESVPYTVTATGSTRHLGAPDQNRFEETFCWSDAAAYYFTDLDDGDTTTVSVANSQSNFAYDSVTDTLIKTDNGALPVRVTFDAVGDGEVRDLADFIEDLMVHGGQYDASEITVEGIDDQIQGAVIDITSGVRDVLRSLADPYSFAIFERAGTIVCKRAGTD